VDLFDSGLRCQQLQTSPAAARGPPTSASHSMRRALFIPRCSGRFNENLLYFLTIVTTAK